MRSGTSARIRIRLLWAFFLALYIWLGLLAVGVDGGTSLIAALLSFGGIFLFVRLYGGDARP